MKGSRPEQAVLTRDGDYRVSLEERTAIALAVGADLFVSIHANADAKRRQTGIETYYLDVGKDNYARRLADRENRAAGRSVGRYRLALALRNAGSETEAAEEWAGMIRDAELAPRHFRKSEKPWLDAARRELAKSDRQP